MGGSKKNKNSNKSKNHNNKQHKNNTEIKQEPKQELNSDATPDGNEKNYEPGKSLSDAAAINSDSEITRNASLDAETLAKAGNDVVDIKKDVSSADTGENGAADTNISKNIENNVENNNVENNSENAIKGNEKEADKRVGKKRDFEKIIINEINTLTFNNSRELFMSILKILLPVAAFAIIIATVFSLVSTKNNKEAEPVASPVETQETLTTNTYTEEPLGENANDEVNQLFATFYKALADGDMETVKALKDYTDETELITYEKRSEFIESYDNISCYTLNGLAEGSYFVYVSYEAKVKDIETKAPGLYPWYVYTRDDGALIIDGDMDEQVTAALKLVTNRDDVIDLYNKVDVSYKEAVSSDEALNTFLTELPTKIKVSVGEALAQIETKDNGEKPENGETSATSEESSNEGGENASDKDNSEILPENKTVNQQVKTTDTVNVRSSDSEEADKISKAPTGTTLTRIEERVNGWSKVIYDGKEAFIKSDYLELISSEETQESAANTGDNNAPAAAGDGAAGKIAGSKVLATTNVNVRNKPAQNGDAIGVAQGGSEYELVENLGEWLKIKFNGQEGYVKAEYFR